MRRIRRTLELGCEIPREEEGGMVREEHLGTSDLWPSLSLVAHWAGQGGISKTEEV